MKKEIDVWIDNNLTGLFEGSYTIHSKEPKEVSNRIKGKLIIDIPEPRIEVTPSQIKEAVIRAAKKRGAVDDPVDWIDAYVVKELFGEGE